MIQIRQLLREIIPVMIGILAALLINNWNEDRKDREYLNQMFSSIQEELEESYEEIEESLPKQQALLDTLAAYIDDEAVSLFEIIIKAGGVYGPTIKNNSWKAIANSRIELVDYKKMSMLSDINATKENLERKEEKIMNYLYANLKNTNQEQKEVFQIIFVDVMTTEKFLQSEIKELVEKLKRSNTQN